MLSWVVEVEGGALKHYTLNNAAVCLAGFKAAREFLEPIFSDRDHELFVAALCDEKARLMQLLCIPGTEAYVRLSLSEIMRQAVCTDCAGIIIAHNHPSGDDRPSQADFDLTRRLSIAAEAMGMALLDHLIFSHGRPVSFRRNGLL